MKILKKILFMSMITITYLYAQGQSKKQTRDQATAQEVYKAFHALTIKKRKEYIKLKEKAVKGVKDQKYFSSITHIHDALKIFDQDVDLHFLNGVCWASIQDVDAALKHYNQVLEIYPTHFDALMNIVEINYFAGRYEDAIKYIEKIIENTANNQRLPLLDFKHLISLTKLSKNQPAKYKNQIETLRQKYTFMDDTPFYYYANALEAFTNDDKLEGLAWILKAYQIFQKPQFIEVWNKALVDTDYIAAHEIMFKTRKLK